MSKGKDLGLERRSTSKALPDGAEERENDRELSLASYRVERTNSIGSISTDFLVGTGSEIRGSSSHGAN